MKKNCSIKVIARDVWLSTPDDLDQATQLLSGLRATWTRNIRSPSNAGIENKRLNGRVVTRLLPPPENTPPIPHKVNEVLKINIEINRVVGILLVKCNSVQIRVFEELLQVANLCRKSA